MSVSSDLQKIMTNFCALYRDEITLEDKYKEQFQELKESEKKYKTLLSNYLTTQQQTCIPVKIKTTNKDDKTEQEQIVYLRLKSKVSQKSVNEDTFKQIIQMSPSVSELKEIYVNLKNDQASLMDVFTQWIIDKLYELNCTKQSVFELSSSGEKKKSHKKRKTDSEEKSEPNPNDVLSLEIVQATQELHKIQSREKTLRKMKKEKLNEIEQEKKNNEPELDKFLSLKPIDKQEQKISMTVKGETIPFYLKKVVQIKKPSLTLVKTKPLIQKTLQNVFTEVMMIDLPFTVENCTKLTQINIHSLFSEFKNNFQQFKKERQVVSTSIVLQKHRLRKSYEQKSSHSQSHEQSRQQSHQQPEEQESDSESLSESDHDNE